MAQPTPNAVARMLGLLGDEWTLLVIQQALMGARRYGDFQTRLPISNSVLSSRLRSLTSDELLERRIYQTNPTRTEYVPTPRSRSLWPVLVSIWDWERRWVPDHVDGLPTMRPLRGGAITDFEITERLIRMLFQQAGVSRFYRTRVLICVPSAITHVEQRAVLEAARRAGAAQTYLIEQPMAAAIGASLPIHDPLGNMVVDIGGGTSEVAVISLGGVVAL